MKILCFGDSNTYGYDPRSFLGDRYPSNVRWVDQLAAHTTYDVYNEGQNGQRIPAMAYSLPVADQLIVMLGTNDLLQGASAKETAVRMEKFLKSILSQYKKILLIAPPTLKLGAWVTSETLIKESSRLASLYQDVSCRLNISFADANLWNVDLTFDGVHFSENGHQSFFEGLISVI